MVYFRTGLRIKEKAMARVTSMTAEILFINDSAPHTCDSVQHILLHPSSILSGQNTASAADLFGTSGMPVPTAKEPDGISRASIFFFHTLQMVIE